MWIYGSSQTLNTNLTRQSRSRHSCKYRRSGGGRGWQHKNKSETSFVLFSAPLDRKQEGFPLRAADLNVPSSSPCIRSSDPHGTNYIPGHISWCVSKIIKKLRAPMGHCCPSSTVSIASCISLCSMVSPSALLDLSYSLWCFTEVLLYSSFLNCLEVRVHFSLSSPLHHSNRSLTSLAKHLAIQ